MKTTMKVVSGLFALALVVGCAKTGDQTFRARAAQDLNCPEGQLRIEHKWENNEAAKKAVGCGREAYYERECEHEGCLWKLRQQGAPGSTPEVAPAE
jgi:hypothetical protein